MTALLLFGSTAQFKAQDTQVEMDDVLERNAIEGISKVYVIVSPLGLPPFENYQSLNFATEIRKLEEGRVEIVNTLADRMPMPVDPFPLPQIPTSLDRRYLESSPKIESEDPRIARVAREIIAGLDDPTTKEVVFEVLRWNRAHLFWGNPNEVPSAVESLEHQTVNCIGFTHLPAAILRHLGIPARTVRTFIARPDQNRLIPHYLLEVYYPSLGGWVTYEPQGPGMPFVENIVLYTHHDWDVQGQRTFRGLARDMNITVSGGVDARIENADLSPPELLDIDFSPSHFDPAQGHRQVSVRLRARDIGTGVETIWMDMQSPTFAGPRMSLHFTLAEGDAHEGIFTAQLGWDLEIENYSKAYRITRMQMADSLGNVREYQARHLEEMGMPTGVTMAYWEAVDRHPPEPVYISPFFPERVTAAPDGFYYVCNYTVSKTASQASGGTSFSADYVHADGTRTRLGGLGIMRVGEYRVSVNTLRYPAAHFPAGTYQMNSLYLRGPNNISYSIMPQNFDQEALNYHFELVADEPDYSGPVDIESIILIAPEGDFFVGNQGVILIETSGAIAPPGDGEGESIRHFRMFFETLDGKKITNRRSVCRSRFGSHHLRFGPNGPRDTPVRIERIELDDKDGKTHTFYWRDVKDKVRDFIPAYMELPE